MNTVELTSQKATLLFNFLTEQGYRPIATQTQDITFKREGKNYIILLMEDDPMYFRLIFPNFYTVSTPDDRARALEAASHCNNRVKVAKTQLTENNVWASTELFLPNLNDLNVVFERCIVALDLAATNFRGAMLNDVGSKT